jgi:hypothetical protein
MWSLFCFGVSAVSALMNSEFRYTPPPGDDDVVPDRLLDALAEATEIPDDMKREIAQKLKADGCITFGVLNGLDRQWSEKFSEKTRRSAPGFRKLTRYAENRTNIPCKTD